MENEINGLLHGLYQKTKRLINVALEIVTPELTRDRKLNVRDVRCAAGKH